MPATQRGHGRLPARTAAEEHSAPCAIIRSSNARTATATVVANAPSPSARSGSAGSRTCVVSAWLSGGHRRADAKAARSDLRMATSRPRPVLPRPKPLLHSATMAAHANVLTRHGDAYAGKMLTPTNCTNLSASPNRASVGCPQSHPPVCLRVPPPVVSRMTQPNDPRSHTDYQLLRD